MRQNNLENFSPPMAAFLTTSFFLCFRKDNDEGLVPAVRLHSRGIDPIMRMSSAIFATSE